LRSEKPEKGGGGSNPKEGARGPSIRSLGICEKNMRRPPTKGEEKTRGGVPDPCRGGLLPNLLGLNYAFKLSKKKRKNQKMRL